MASFTDLQKMRKQAYARLGNGRDSLFDLMDAVLISRHLNSYAELSLSPVFRRGWPSLYKGLARSTPPSDKLLQLYCERLPEPTEWPLLLAGDHTAWARIWSPTLKKRTYGRQPQPYSAASAVTIGQGYSTLVCVPEASGSWVLPLLHERISSFETPVEKAAKQLKHVCAQLRHRPISLWDSEYGCAHFVELTAEIDCDKLMRVRPNRVLYSLPDAYSGLGSPPKHGDKFTLKDSQTWWPADQQQIANDETLGQLRLRLQNDACFGLMSAFGDPTGP